MHHLRLPILFLLPLLFILPACHQRTHNVVRSYYYWQSNDDLTPEEIALLERNKVTRLYRKILDIDWSDAQGPIPVASGYLTDLDNTLNKIVPLDISFVPVVFITNQTFQHIDSTDIKAFAIKVLRRCFKGYDSIDIVQDSWQAKLSHPCTEIQFDCDWTVSTAKKYFYFLQVVQQLLPDKNISVSATIRLHQYKYPEKTGVPPVNRGMLMMYNLTDPTRYSKENSIFNYKKASAYFINKKAYPLPLDFVLPAYCWGLVFRNQKFYQIENGLSKQILDTCSFLTAKPDDIYQVTKETVYKNIFLRPGDEIKAEFITKEALIQVSTLSAKAINTDSFHVAFFDLSNYSNTYNHETIETVYSNFK